MMPSTLESNTQELCESRIIRAKKTIIFLAQDKKQQHRERKIETEKAI